MTGPEHTILPTEQRFSQVRRRVENAINSSKPVLRKENSFEIKISRGEISSSEADAEEIKIMYGEDDHRLEGVTAAGYYRSWFAENLEPEFQWQEILRLGGSLKFSENVTGWAPEGKTVDLDRIKKEYFSDSLDQTDPILRANGFLLSYEISQKIDADPKEFVELDKSHVLEAFEDLR